MENHVWLYMKCNKPTGKRAYVSSSQANCSWKCCLCSLPPPPPRPRNIRIMHIFLFSFWCFWHNLKEKIVWHYGALSLNWKVIILFALISVMKRKSINIFIVSSTGCTYKKQVTISNWETGTICRERNAAKSRSCQSDEKD